MYEIITQLPFYGFHVKGILTLPVKARSLIIFSSSFGGQTQNPQEQKIAKKFQQEGLGTLIFDLLDGHDELPKEYKEIDLFSRGLITSTNWLNGHSEYKSLGLAYFGIGSGAAAALKSVGQSDSVVKTVVSLSGRLNLITEDLPKVTCPALLIVGELDFELVKTNKQAIKYLDTQKQLAVVPGTSRHFEEPGKRKEAVNIAISWYKKQLSNEIQNLKFMI